MLITEYLYTSEREGRLSKQEIIRDIQIEMAEYFKNAREKSNTYATKALMDKLDKSLNEYIKNSNLHNCIACKKGCSACCSTRVTITENEGHLIQDYIENNDIQFNLDKLASLRNLDGEKWTNIPTEHRKCVFLDENGSCKIYPVRPTACRKLLVTSNSSLCAKRFDTFNIDRVLDYQSEILVSAMWQVSKSGNLPDILYPMLKTITQLNNSI